MRVVGLSSFALLLAALLASCGGGGGGSTPPPTPPDAPAISYGPSGAPATQFIFTAQTQVSLTPNNSGGAADSWKVTPALPAGLSFDTASGAISGTPTAFAPTNVTVSATNTGGSSSVTLMLRSDAVLLNLGATCLIDLSGAFQQGVLAIDSTNVLTMDCGGQQHWVLWNYATGALVAQGDPCPIGTCAGTNPGGLAPFIGLAGGIAVVPQVPSGTSGPEGFQIISTVDGTVRASIMPGGGTDWVHVAADGSYVCSADVNTGNLTVWAPDGSALTTVTGNYKAAKVYCAPGQVQVALGPKGSSVIETITVPDGTSSVSPGFAGTFNSWFTDGSAFLTNVGNQVWVYNPAAVQLDHTTSLATINGLAGWGPWFWNFDGANLNIYKVGASSAAIATYAGREVMPSGSTIGVLGDGVHLIDLTGAAPAEADYSPPFSEVYAAVSASQWVVGSGNWGAVVDGPSLATTPRYFGYGQVRGLAGSPVRFAVGTSIGSVLVFNTSDLSLETTLNLGVYGNQLGISADGTILAVLTQQADSSLTIQTLSLPSGTVINSWSYPSGGPVPVNITLSNSGALLGQTLGTSSAGNSLVTRQVTASSGGAVLWSDTGGSLPVLISLDDSLIAASDGTNSNIYLNDALSSAIAAVAIGWLQGNNLVANVPGTQAAIFNSSGVKQGGPLLPYLYGPIQVLGATSIYDEGINAIYSLTTGQKTWTPPAVAAGVRGTAAGPLLVFPTLSNQLLAEPY